MFDYFILFALCLGYELNEEYSIEKIYKDWDKLSKMALYFNDFCNDYTDLNEYKIDNSIIRINM